MLKIFVKSILTVIGIAFGLFCLLLANHGALTLGASEHYQHWAQNFADESGYLGDPNHVDMKVEFCHQVGLTDDDILAYVPLPETVGMVFTHNYYIRRSYEEGLATLGFAGERLAARSGYAKVLYEGLRSHYDLEVRNFKTHAYAEGDHGVPAATEGFGFERAGGEGD